ncbi:uncharacterized protein pnhd [Heterodontus francisci]|uniref:uncharacterized protein pnhd n=1 Tax=Heterodontus francisci TaxID=7792 RepID=UPI00355BDDAF
MVHHKLSMWKQHSLSVVDISSSPVSVDIGKCNSHCGSPQRSANYNSEFLGFLKHLSMLEQLQTNKHCTRARFNIKTFGALQQLILHYNQSPSFLVKDIGSGNKELMQNLQEKKTFKVKEKPLILSIKVSHLTVLTLFALECYSGSLKRLLEHTLELVGTPMGSSCPHGSLCEPVRLRVERFLLFDGVRELEVVEECQCNVRPTGCVRSLLLKTYSPDSPLQFTVDVGRCSNPTAPGGLGCVPTKFESVVLESSNGLELIQTVELCEVRENCYRLPHVEHYYVITITSSGEKEEGLKEIDVGRCLGVCTAGSGCLLRDIRSKDQCIIWEDGSSNGCSPREFETHTFRSRLGKIRTVYAIKSCKCHGRSS